MYQLYSDGKSGQRSLKELYQPSQINLNIFLSKFIQYSACRAAVQTEMVIFTIITTCKLLNYTSILGQIY